MKKVLLAFAMTWCLGMLGTAHAQAPAPDAQPPAAAACGGGARGCAGDDDRRRYQGALGPEGRGQSEGRSRRHHHRHRRATFPSATRRKGLTLGDVVNQVGQNMIAINFVWTLFTGFLVMFMQAGFAIVETGLCRAKNANHTMMMNFMVYGAGMLAYWLIGFAIQEGGVGAVANLGGTAPLNGEYAIKLFGKDWGLFGMNGVMLGGATYDVGVMVMFLFQMVFMDTALTIVTGTAAERWKYSAFLVSSLVMGAFTYPLFANWAWGGGWLANARRELRSRTRLLGLRRLRRRPRGRRADGPGDGHPHRAAHRQVHPRRKGQRRFPATTSRWCCSAASSWRSGGSVSIPGRRSARRRTATSASAPSPSIRCWPAWRARSAPCATCGPATASRTRR